MNEITPGTEWYELAQGVVTMFVAPKKNLKTFEINKANGKCWRKQITTTPMSFKNVKWKNSY